MFIWRASAGLGWAELRTTRLGGARQGKVHLKGNTMNILISALLTVGLILTVEAFRFARRASFQFKRGRLMRLSLHATEGVIVWAACAEWSLHTAVTARVVGMWR
jgi:hypothetical protein